ncbi:MAG: hypothetical protein HGB10_09240 [Coriobacteriia bacterium]|nr:hypothetical protein [Coriobacteriia bacterium]
MAGFISGVRRAIARDSRIAVRLVALTAVLALTLGPAVAMGAAAKAPAAGGPIDVQMWSEAGQLIVISAVTVPQDVKLPATVRIPVPAGATVQWAGEVLGGDLAADPSRKYKIVKSPVGGEYAEFTLEETRSAQVDADMSALTVNGDSTNATFEWIQSVSSDYTSFSVRVPAGVANVKIEPAPTDAPDENAAGEQLFSGDPLKLKPGAKQTVSFSYTTGAAATTAGSSGSQGLTPLVIGLAVALAGAIVFLFVTIRRQGAAGEPAPEPRSSAKSAESKATGPAEKTSSADDDDWGFIDES